jgi:hypothetical protein
MPTHDRDELVRRCGEARAAVKAHEATPAIDEEWGPWEAELSRLAAERDRLCAEAESATPPSSPPAARRR